MLFFFPDYPKETDRIVLYIRFHGENTAEVQDLHGNGKSSGYQKCGYGKQIFNVGIQALYSRYEISFGDPLGKEIEVKGETSPVGDPETEPDRSTCRDIRNGFWSEFGFHVYDPNAFRTYIHASLSELVIRGGKTANGALCEISIDEFWPIGEAPTIFQSDIDALMSVEFGQFNLDSCPSLDDIYREWNSAVSSSRVVRYTSWLVLSGLSIHLSLFLHETKNIIVLSVVGVFFGYLVAIFVENKVWQRLPRVKRHWQLLERRNSILENVSGYIENLETTHNGLLWRLQKGLCQFDSVFEDSVYVEMAEQSRRQLPYLMTKSDKYEHYIDFMNNAKRIAICNGLAEG
ncbi:MAG: hypothetical protein AB2710_20005 [Candidatus Thiodiazotropha sp.]